MKALVLPILFLFALGLVCLMPNSRAEAPQQEDTSREDATKIEMGVMTQKQREHSKLYKKYNNERIIPDLIRTQTGEIQVYRLAPLVAELEGHQQSSQELLRQITCTADTIIIGTVRGKASQLTEDQNFVFTDYEITLEEVLKSTSPKSLDPNDEITVTRPGGTILLNGRIVRARDELFPFLTIGKQYLLFLRFIPTVATYATIESGETFQLQHSKARILKEDALGRFPREENSVSFVSEIRMLAAQSCDEKKRGRQ